MNGKEITTEFINNLKKTTLEFKEGSGDRELVEEYVKHLEGLPTKRIIEVMLNGQ